MASVEEDDLLRQIYAELRMEMVLVLVGVSDSSI